MPRSLLALAGLFQLAIATMVGSGGIAHAVGPKPFFDTYCIDCHTADDPKGDMILESLTDGPWFVDEAARWDRVLDVLRHGKMPPEKEDQPAATERAAVIGWIRDRLLTHCRDETNQTVLPTARRLTNVEYENTMRDLLGFRLDLIDSLPKDAVTPYRFNNTPDMMRIGPEQLDRYLECNRRAMASAIVDPSKPAVHTTRQEWQPAKVEQGLGMDEIECQTSRKGTPGEGMPVKSTPPTGEFRIRFQASAILPRGIDEMPLRLVMGQALNINSSAQQIRPVGTVRLTGPDPKVFEFTGRIENFPASVITPQNLYDDGTLNDENDFLYWPRRLSMPRAVVNWMEFECPVADVWPPEHHTRILFDSPLRESNPPVYLRGVLGRFMARAYRRPATPAEIDRFVAVYELIQPSCESFEGAIRETLAMVLISPPFLYHTVTDDRTSRQFELASKLSYFLWASMPDDELMRLAADGRLDDPKVIAEQAQRLLADDRSEDFVRNFTMQWLGLAKMQTVPINSDLFPRFLYYVPAGERAGTEEPYRPTIRHYMLDETTGFVAELIRRNAPVSNLVDSDFAYLNQPLAAHYGVEGVQGHELRPVPIRPEHHLGGLLTHGSVLIGNGTGSAPHPIYRAVWLREAILGDDVPPPPAEVPALADSAGESAEKAVTIKDLLERHRQVESCNECHVRLDPWGIPFEHYNAVGRYQPFVPREGKRVRGFNRAKDGDLAGYAAYLASVNTVEVQADARVPLGPDVDGMEQLKAYLLRDRREAIAENMVRRLLAYAIGRDLTYRDRFAVEQLLAQLAKNGYRLRDMILAVCESETFRGIDSSRDTSSRDSRAKVRRR